MFASSPVAIVDIGSNSVRLVVYSGAKRIPSIIFNEKVMAGLGRDVAETGLLDEGAQARALAALERFRLLTRQMGVVRTRVVATAAVREAANGDAFLDRVGALGFEPRILSGDEEARMAGLGVVSAIPDADGIVGDLGGGSLELVELRGRRIRRSASLPLGVLKLDRVAEVGEATFAKRIAKSVAAAGFDRAAEGRPFYLVGGSWRALATVEMGVSGHPLPITHQHVMAPARPAELREEIARMSREQLRAIPALSAGRIPTLARANQLLEALIRILRPDRLIVSSFGIREGLLFDDLEPAQQGLDPLVEAARDVGAGLGRFVQHGERLDAWLAPVFDDPPERARLRLAACLLADIAWAAHPDFRAERGIDMALHGNWVAIDAPGRVMLAQALFSSFGGGSRLPYPKVAALCPAESLERASHWGYAIRLGQRLSGGVEIGLERSRLSRDGDRLVLTIAAGEAALIGETVERRLKTLATAMGLKPEKVIGRDAGRTRRN
ncbi:Ppx/GppA family phosphatase [Sphingosinicella terrae]|uniref:Ppx/GppA family phosphatase n=1 Tax=Sphingosinicella terrae TaxID=2172047 RepID=UPI000E0D86D2|nr:Ppx/GppA family phosphatase [Sphingosinicella terrae]